MRMDHCNEPPTATATCSDDAGNPLLDFTDLPRFDQIQPGDVTPAVDALLADARDSVATHHRRRDSGRHLGLGCRAA